MPSTKHLSNLGKFTRSLSFTATGLLGAAEHRVLEEAMLSINVRDVNPGNVIVIEGRITNDSVWKTAGTLTGALEDELVEIAAYDFVRVRCTTYDVPGSAGQIYITSYTDLKNPSVYTLDQFGDPALNVAGSIQSGGLNIGGLVTEVTIDDSSWTLLPAAALSNRNALNIQNFTGFECKVRYDNLGGYVGMVIQDGVERFYNITDNVVLYGRAEAGAGSVTLFIEELA